MLNPTAIRHASLIRYLTRHIAGEVRFDDTSRRLYATDASHYQIEPVGVIIPRTPEDLRVAVQIAADLAMPITTRGGGTSLSGQAIGSGLVLDCSKYLNQIGEVDLTQRTVRVQPGVVLDHLNAALAPHSLMFGPDVAPSNRATLGGMIGNNSAGSRSVVYGMTADHVRSLSVVLADGTATRFAPLSPTEYQRKLELSTREGEIYRTVDETVRTQAREIERRFPKILRRVSGYNLPPLLGLGRNLTPLLVGSEGTLVVIEEAELALVPRPRCRGLVVPHFQTLAAALEAVAVCLEVGPSAVEVLDQMLLDLARDQRSLKSTMASIEGRPAAVLLVELTGDTPAEVSDRVEKLTKRLQGMAGMSALVSALEPAKRDPLWNLRSAGMPLLYGIPGDRKPVTFVEDCAVAPERLPEFTARFRDILQKHGTNGAYYGHASVGCLHIRPLLNLHDRTDVQSMRAIMEDVTDLVLTFEGSLSGEHGDGLVRSEWNRKMFGDDLYEAFRRIKRVFDPAAVLNPGKIVDAPPMDQQLRVTPGLPVPNPPTILDYTAQGGFFRSIELCNGAAVCRKTQGGAMCPSFRATRDERDSTRGRANALRIALSTAPGPEGSPTSKDRSPLADRWLADVLDLCLSCKACKSECPANVDLAKLKAEFQHAYYARRARPLAHRVLRRIHTVSPLAARWARLGNWVGRIRPVRWLMQVLAGIDRRRSLPHFHRDHFRSWFESRPVNPVDDRPVVVLLDDCFTTYQEPQIGQAAVEVLERLGFRVQLANLCCGRAQISKGYLTDARELARTGLAKLAPLVAQGVPVLGLEPSCILTLGDEWTELGPGSDAKSVAASIHLVEDWVHRELAGRNLARTWTPAANPILFHPHCHQRALVGPGGSAAALQRISSSVEVLDAGCCGMAGSFGYEVEHYDLSVQIANLALIPQLQATPHATLVATGTSCRHQIRDLTGREARHPIELIAESLR